MTITLNRSTCCNLDETISREWLMTNGLGGYAAGTVAGVLTRRQHGLLVAQPPDAKFPQLLLTKIDEEVVFDQRIYNLGTNEYRDGTLSPSGFVHLEAFRLEEGFPIFTYRLGGINGMMLEKRIWMPQGQNTTYIQYRLLRTTSTDSSGHRRSGITGALSNSNVSSSEYTEANALSITLLPFVTSRPCNHLRHGDNGYHFQVRTHLHADDIEHDEWGAALSLPRGVAGCTIRDGESGYPFHIMAVGHAESQTAFIPTGVWYWNFLHRHDTENGQPATDDLYLPGVIRSTLWPDENATLTIIVSSEDLSSQTFRLNQLTLSYKRSVERQQQLAQEIIEPRRFFGEGGEAARAHQLNVLPLTTSSDPYAGGEAYLQLLVQAADRFLVRTTLGGQRPNMGTFPADQGGVPIALADYFGMENKTRDTLIALPGLMLTTKRYDEALGTLRVLARYFKNGLLPDRLPLHGQSLAESDYGSVDTTLWFFYALDAYLRATRNDAFLEDFFPQLVEAIDSYIQGTSLGICVDPTDGLLVASQPGKALTWMNASVDGVAVTPRSGKAVEVNALWYHALSLLLEWSLQLSQANRPGRVPSHYQRLLAQGRHSFQQRFWYSEGGYLYDVIDGPGGNDAALRPNQLLALSLRYSVLDTEYRQSIFDVISQQLLTPFGLRTLAPRDAEYRGKPGQSYADQQRSLHQGSAWSWLLGPYIDVMLAMRNYSEKKISLHEEYPVREYLWRKSLLLLEPFQGRFSQSLLGMCEGVFAGDVPYTPDKGCASLLSTGELLRIYDTLTHIRVLYDDRVLSH